MEIIVREFSFLEVGGQTALLLVGSRYFLAGEGSDVSFPRFFLSLPCQRSPLFIRGWLVGDFPVLCWNLERWKCCVLVHDFLPQTPDLKNISVYSVTFFLNGISASPSWIYIFSVYCRFTCKRTFISTFTFFSVKVIIHFFFFFHVIISKLSLECMKFLVIGISARLKLTFFLLSSFVWSNI